MNKGSHISSLDDMRGLAMLLVILGHALTEDVRAVSPAAEYLYRMIYRFHMPLWFLLSGVLYGLHRERYLRSGARYFAARLHRLALPFVLYGAAVYGVFFLLWRVPFLSSFLSGAGRQLMSPDDYAARSLLGENPYAFHLWFLEALLLFSVLAHGVCMLAKGRADRLLALIACAVVIWRLADDNRPGIQYPWIVCAFMRDLPWYLLGVLLPGRATRLPEFSHKLLIFLLSAAYMTLRVLWFPPLMAMPVPRILLQAAEYVAALGLMLSVYFLSRALRRVRRAVQWVGRRSFLIYLAHQPLCSVTGLALSRLTSLPPLLNVLVCVTVGLACPLLIGCTADAIRLRRSKEGCV